MRTAKIAWGNGAHGAPYLIGHMDHGAQRKVKAWIVPRLQLLLGIAVSMLALQLVNSLSGNALNAWGVLPRDPASLPGILAAP